MPRYQPLRQNGAMTLGSSILNASKLNAILANPESSLLANQLVKLLSQTADQPADLDQLVVTPLLEKTPLSASSITCLLKVALASDLQNLLPHQIDLSYRLYLLSPDFVLTRLVGPLWRFGVANPAKVIRTCPDLFTAALVDVEGDESKSCLVSALTTLRGFLTTKDLATLVKNFPGTTVVLIYAVLCTGNSFALLNL